MTRIIAGSARGARIGVPDSGTRPTSDRVRESLFGSLEAAGVIEGARVLDLYAGSGALGLEALSRGAASADLVEHARSAAEVVRRNASIVAKAGGLSPARVHQVTVRSFLERAVDSYDLVFSDPPYDLDDAAMTADLSALARLLARDALVVIERGSRSTPPTLAEAGLALVRDKTYGDTRIWWAEPTGDQPPIASQSR